MQPSPIEISSRRFARGVLRGTVIGALVTFPTLVIASLSGGAGHGDYIAARALFPVPMLLTRLTGSIGVISLSAALFQFPLYGAAVGWSIHRNERSLITILAAMHIALAAACFVGALPDFS